MYVNIYIYIYIYIYIDIDIDIDIDIVSLLKSGIFNLQSSKRVWEPSCSWIEELFLQILQSSIFKPRTYFFVTFVKSF